jgi:hypothetical protein
VAGPAQLRPFARLPRSDDTCYIRADGRSHIRADGRSHAATRSFPGAPGHGQWPGEIVRHLTTILPAGFRAAPKVHLGSPFEVDVSTYDLDARAPDTTADSSDGGTGTLTALSPTLTVEADLSEPDE